MSTDSLKNPAALSRGAVNPTPEQVAQWAREAGVTQYLHADESLRGYVLPPETLNRLVTRAMAEQAEADAGLCDELACRTIWEPSQGVYRPSPSEAYSAAIRANAPKVTT